MKRPYMTPDMLVHGTVNQLTAASLDSDRTDRIFNAAAEQTDTDNGRLDQCWVSADNPYTCPPDA